MCTFVEITVMCWLQPTHQGSWTRLSIKHWPCCDWSMDQLLSHRCRVDKILPFKFDIFFVCGCIFGTNAYVYLFYTYVKCRKNMLKTDHSTDAQSPNPGRWTSNVVCSYFFLLRKTNLDWIQLKSLWMYQYKSLFMQYTYYFLQNRPWVCWFSIGIMINVMKKM